MKLKTVITSVIYLGILVLSVSALSAQINLDTANPINLPGAGFGATAPQGIAYDPATGNLWVVEETTTNTLGTVFEITQAGALASSFTLMNPPGPANNFNGIVVDPLTGNLLIADDGQVFEYMKNGTFVQQVLNLPGNVDAFGLAVHPVTNNIWIADDQQNEIAEWSRSPAGTGTEISSFSTTALIPGFDEPEGLAFFGPQNDLLVIDNFQGTRTLYLVSTAGALVQTVLDLDAQGFDDPEGVANVLNTKLCIAVEGGDPGVTGTMNAVVCYNNLSPPGTPLVVPGPTVPTLNEWGLIALGLLLAGAAYLKLRVN